MANSHGFQLWMTPQMPSWLARGANVCFSRILQVVLKSTGDLNTYIDWWKENRKDLCFIWVEAKRFTTIRNHWRSLEPSFEHSDLVLWVETKHNLPVVSTAQRSRLSFTCFNTSSYSIILLLPPAPRIKHSKKSNESMRPVTMSLCGLQQRAALTRSASSSFLCLHAKPNQM